MFLKEGSNDMREVMPTLLLVATAFGAGVGVGRSSLQHRLEVVEQNLHSEQRLEDWQRFGLALEDCLEKRGIRVYVMTSGTAPEALVVPARVVSACVAEMGR